MSWGGYIPGDMIRAVIEEGKVEEFVDTFYGVGYSKEVQSEEKENEAEGESQDV